MTFEEAMTAAAHVAEQAVNETMADYRAGQVVDEDDINPYLLGALAQAFRGTTIGGLTWRSSILRHRSGVADEEGRSGADMLIHVSINGNTQTYSKGVLIQAKRVEPGVKMSPNEHKRLVEQCDKMLSITPASYVFDYAKGSMRCGSANKISGSANRALYDACDWTSYRFFLELFRCPIGDRRIQSSLARDLVIPDGLLIKGKGHLSVP